MAVATQSRIYYDEPFFLPLVAGTDFHFELTFWEVRETTLNGKLILPPQRASTPFPWTNWGDFRMQLRDPGGLAVIPVAVNVEGPATDGVLKVEGRKEHTWSLQELGAFSGDCTLIGHAPGGHDVEIYPGVWNLEPGSTGPSAAAYTDWTSLPVR